LLASQPQTHERLAAYAHHRGVDPSRLIFAPRLANPDHLGRYPLADVFLDTLPYGAHTTASDALWMGVPVITLPGRSFAARVCSSLVRAAGLPDLVAASGDEYIDLAVRLWREPGMLQAVKRRLAEGRDTCALFDIQLLTRNLEGLYRQMAIEAKSGCSPRPDLTNLDAYLEVGASLDHDTTEIGAQQNYVALYRAGLAKLHHARPLPEDRRFWTHAAIEGAERDFAVAAVRRGLDDTTPVTALKAVS
jgi:hypothetical protein